MLILITSISCNRISEHIDHIANRIVGITLVVLTVSRVELQISIYGARDIIKNKGNA